MPYDVKPNRYLLHISSSSEGISSRIEESGTSSTSNELIYIGDEKIRKNLNRCLSRGTLDVQTSSGMMGTHGYSLNQHWFLFRWKDITHWSIVIAWFGDIFHGWNKGLWWQINWIDGLCQTFLQLLRLDTPSPIYKKYAKIWRSCKLYTTKIQGLEQRRISIYWQKAKIN